jgi:hypothetical protein
VKWNNKTESGYMFVIGKVATQPTPELEPEQAETPDFDDACPF